jgi:hypothetical protein
MMEPAIPGNIAHDVSLLGGQHKHLRSFSMLNRFMITAAAAALIAGTGLANAQGTGTGRETGPSMQQQGAPSSERPSQSAQPEEKMQPPQGGKRAQDNMKPGPKADKAAQDNNMRGDNMKGEAPRNAQNNDKGKPEGRSQTVGQAGAGAKLSSEQRTKISTVIRNEHVAPVTHINFEVSVGTRVPRDVSFRPLPAEIVTIYPEWRGYEFILVRDQIVVVDPQTYEIVAVLDA